MLDMLTTDGLGCAFFALFSWDRYFAPDALRLIPVSPIGLHSRVPGVIFWEVLLVWPFLVAALSGRFALRRFRQAFKDHGP